MSKFAPISVVIVAGGKGLRMGNALPKQFLPLQGKPILYYALHIFHQTFPEAKLIVVLPKDQLSYSNILLQAFSSPIEITIVSGGATRFHSVQNGLKEVLPNSTVFVHDGVRPFINEDLLQRCYDQAQQSGSAIPAVPIKDSIREISASSNRALNRNHLVAIQTPQTFTSDIIIKAFEQPYSELFSDEATVVEHAGNPVTLVEGLPQNIKITTPEDMQWAKLILEDESV